MTERLPPPRPRLFPVLVVRKFYCNIVPRSARVALGLPEDSPVENKTQLRGGIARGAAPPGPGEEAERGREQRPKEEESGRFRGRGGGRSRPAASPRDCAFT